MEVLANKFTRNELYWELCRYRRELTGSSISDRTFRHWRQKLNICPDETGMFWRSDLERLKDLILYLSQGQTIEQISRLLQEKSYANS